MQTFSDLCGGCKPKAVVSPRDGPASNSPTRLSPILESWNSTIISGGVGVPHSDRKRLAISETPAFALRSLPYFLACDTSPRGQNALGPRARRPFLPQVVGARLFQRRRHRGR